MKKLGRLIACFMALVLMLSMIPASTVQAYFNRGTVQLQLASTSVNIKTGESYNLSVSMNPASYTGLPGCGMATCPQECDPSCIIYSNNNDGECQCAGMVPQTAYASLNVTVANTMIATAAYSSGVLKITGVRQGQTAITLQGTLWEHTNSAPQVINVTVTKPSSGGTSGEQNTANTSNTSGSGTVETVAPNGKNTTGTKSQTESTAVAEGDSDTGETAEGTENEKRTIDTPKMGTVEMVTLNNFAATGKSEFETAKENGTSVTFQKVDSGKKVIYSWTFRGKDITEPKDINMGIELLNEPPSLKSESGKLNNALYLSFAHEGKLPGKAQVSISVGDKYKDGEKLSLYYLNNDAKTLDLVKENLVVENGYVEFEIDHCSDYALSAGLAEKTAGSTSIMIFVISAVVVVAAAGIFVVIRKKRRIHTI